MPNKTEKRETQPQTCVIHYRRNDYGSWRLWREHWFGDQFDIMTRDEFKEFKKQASSLGFQFQFHGDDE